MPLSEEELRLLEQMERALVEEDPKFASTLRGSAFRRSARRKAILAGIVFAGGIALLMVGVITGLWPIGLVGFLVMLGSATVALGAFKGQPGAGAQPVAGAATQHPSGFKLVDGGRSSRRPRRQRSRSQGSFMERLEERWRRRRDQGNGF